MTNKEVPNPYKSIPKWLGNQRQRDLIFTLGYNSWLKNTYNLFQVKKN